MSGVKREGFNPIDGAKQTRTDRMIAQLPVLRPIQKPARAKTTEAKTKPTINARALDVRAYVTSERQKDPNAKCEIVARSSGVAEINLWRDRPVGHHRSVV